MSKRHSSRSESLPVMHIRYVMKTRHATECTILLWRADRGNLINLPNRFPYYRSSGARQIEAHFVQLQVSSGSFFAVIFKCIILAIFYSSSQWRTDALSSTHGWRNLIILNNTWQCKTTLKYFKTTLSILKSDIRKYIQWYNKIWVHLIEVVINSTEDINWCISNDH